MSELKRLRRVFGSWVGGMRHRKKRRISIYEHDDALLILTDLGLLMSPAGLEFVSGNSTRREDFLQQIYISEDELDIDIIQDNVRINPSLAPNVREDEKTIQFTIIFRGEELIVAEFVRS